MLILFPWDIYPEISLLDHKIFLIFSGIVVLFSLTATSISEFSPTTRKVFLLFTSLPTLVTSCVFDNKHSNRNEMTSHCAFELLFPDY